MIPPVLEALRPRQWTKNLILFVPLVFAQRLTDTASLLRALAAFGVFCLLSGAIYLINDLQDLEQDRLHPVKSRRPLASGRLSPGAARLALGVSLAVSLVGALLLSPELMIRVEAVYGARDFVSLPSFLVWWVVYLVLLAAYSYALKHLVVLDVMAIAMGFVVRTIAGTSAIAVDISHWLLICTIFLALFLALAKRRHEIVFLAEDARSHRKTLADYDAPLLDQMIGVVAAACLISYALYTMAPETIEKFATDRLNVTIPFVIYGLFRYLYLVHRKADGGDPSASLLADRPIQIAVALWGLTVVAVLYA